MSEPRVRLRAVAAGLTDVGRQRRHNEDFVLVKADVGLFAVADGMGGHNAGDVASKLTATSLSNYFDATRDGATIGELPEEYGDLPDAARRLINGVRKANHDVHLISNTHHQHHGMGSTIVAIHADEGGGELHVAHVGDSRCYRIRDGEIEQLTRDHSLINDALEIKPDLTKEELARLPKNIITRALGMKDVVKVDHRTVTIEPGDTFLLCSDGLTGMVQNSLIAEIVGIADSLKDACDLLIAEANEAGGNDNISAVLIRFDERDADADAAIEVGDAGELDEVEALRSSREPAITPPPSSASPRLVVVDEASVDVRTGEMTELDEDLDEGADPFAATGSSDAHADPSFADTEPSAEIDPVLLAPPSKPIAVQRVITIEPEPLPVTVRGRGSIPDKIEAGEHALEGASIEGVVPEEIAAILNAGGEVDLELAGPWAGTPSVPRCKACRHELYPGNMFCTECGARIDEEQLA